MGEYNSDFDDVGVLAYLGKDIMVDLKNRDLRFGDSNDFMFTKWKDNIKQAMVIRLKTPLGFYSQHPNYGSRLFQVIGSPINDLTISFAKGVVFEALLSEPRIEKIKDIDIEYNPYEKSLEINVKVELIEDMGYLNLVFDYFLEA
jgi:phage baseplate assembly protein W